MPKSPSMPLPHNRPDYEATVDDLVRLGFLPKEIAEDAAKRNIVAPVLGAVLEQLSNGGACRAMDTAAITHACWPLCIGSLI